MFCTNCALPLIYRVTLGKSPNHSELSFSSSVARMKQEKEALLMHSASSLPE